MPKDPEELNVNKSASNTWLKVGKLFPATTGFMTGKQDQIISTKNYKQHIPKDLNYY